MGILDEAIRDHLDLKRQHGARESELAEIEEEALGSGDQPDPFTAGELFSEVSTPGAPVEGAGEQTPGPATPPPPGLEDAPPLEDPTQLVEPRTPPPAPEPATPAPEPPIPEAPAPEPPASEPPAPEPPAESGSLDDLLAEEAEAEPPPPAGPEPPVPPPPPPDTESAARPGGEAAAPIEELTPLEEPPPPLEEPPSPLEEPPPPAKQGQRGRALGREGVPTQEYSAAQETGEDLPAIEEEPASDQGPQLYDFETDGEGDADAQGPDDDAETLYVEDVEEEEPYPEEQGGTSDEVVTEDEEEEEEVFETAIREPDPGEDTDDDLLSGQPEFMDEDTDGEGLWFEKGPPKDFDFEEEDEK